MTTEELIFTQDQTQDPIPSGGLLLPRWNQVPWEEESTVTFFLLPIKILCPSVLYISDMITYYEKKAGGGHELIDAIQDKQTAALKDKHEVLARNLKPEHYEMFTHILFKDDDLRSAIGEETLSGMKSIVSIYEAIPKDQRCD